MKYTDTSEKGLEAFPIIPQLQSPPSFDAH